MERRGRDGLLEKDTECSSHENFTLWTFSYSSRGLLPPYRCQGPGSLTRPLKGPIKVRVGMGDGGGGWGGWKAL